MVSSLCINKLSAKQIDKIATPAKRMKLSDGGALNLVVEPNGTKKWQWYYRWGKAQRVLSIGTYPQVSLAQARAKRDQARQLRADGIDPMKQMGQRVLLRQQAANQAVATTKGPTFADIANTWYDNNRTIWSQKHSIEVWKSLQSDILPKIGTQQPQAITGTMVMNDILNPMQKAGKFEKTRRVLQRVRDILDVAIATGDLTGSNPCNGLTKALAARPKVRNRPAIIILDELRQMLKALEAQPCHHVTHLAMRFLALTAVRPGNIRKAEWKDIKGNCWHIPAESMKGGKAFKVPLSSHALDVIAALRPLTGHGRYLFVGGRGYNTRMSENALGYALNRAGYQDIHCPHGWRSSFSSIMNSLYPKESQVIDCALAHTQKDKVQSAYNRTDYYDERVVLMQAWGDMLMDGFPAPSQLLHLPQR